MVALTSAAVRMRHSLACVRCRLRIQSSRPTIPDSRSPAYTRRQLLSGIAVLPLPRSSVVASAACVTYQ